MVRPALAAGILLVCATAVADKLSVDEKQPLKASTVDGKRRFQHPALGYWFSHPGDGFVEKPEAAATIPNHVPPGIDVFGHSYVDAGGKHALVVVDIADTPPDKEAYEGMVDGLRYNMFRALVGDLQLKVDHEDLVWNRDGGESHSQTSSGQIRFRFDTYAGTFAGKRRTIAIMAIAADDSLVPVVASFHR